MLLLGSQPPLRLDPFEDADGLIKLVLEILRFQIIAVISPRREKAPICTSKVGAKMADASGLSFDLVVQLLVAVAVAVDFKLRAGQLVFGLVLVHLGELHGAADQRVFDLQLDHRAVLIHIDLKGLVREDIPCRTGDFLDNPIPIGDFDISTTVRAGV